MGSYEVRYTISKSDTLKIFLQELHTTLQSIVRLISPSLSCLILQKGHK
jgi:hypothetical protein